MNQDGDRQPVVLDLDGTLLIGNSFPEWVRFALVKAVRTKDFRILLSLGLLVSRRKVLRCSHSTFKSTLVRLIPDEWSQQFGSRLVSQLRPKIMDACSIAKSEIFLATAAPRVYAERFAECIGIAPGNVLASEWQGEEFWDNVGENKASALLERFSVAQLARGVLFTDHYEDLPSARLFGRVVLVEPSKRTLEKMRYLSEVEVWRQCTD